MRVKVEQLIEKVIGDGSSVFEEEKAEDEEKIVPAVVPPAKTDCAVSTQPGPTGE